MVASLLILAVPCSSRAQDPKTELQGYYSNQLKIKMNKTNSRVAQNLKDYRKNKSIALLDDSFAKVMQLRSEMDDYLNSAVQKLLDTPENFEMARLKAQIDKLEVITVRDDEMPYLCDQLYAIGQLYIKADREMAKRCFKNIDEKFNTNVSVNCANRAKSALDSMK